MKYRRIEEQLQHFKPISLEEMTAVKLMNRVDNKYIATENQWQQLLPLLENSYMVQQTHDERAPLYNTLYFDTEDFAMYNEHHNKRAKRQKIRARNYVSSNITFLEIKDKNNHGRTHKQRISIESINNYLSAEEFVDQNARFALNELKPQLENSFRRMTFVNNRLTERLTIDLNLEFKNIATCCNKSLEGLVIIELKQDGNVSSYAKKVFTELGIHKTGFSKYCVGEALTNKALKQNLFKNRLRQIVKLIENSPKQNH